MATHFWNIVVVEWLRCQRHILAASVNVQMSNLVHVPVKRTLPLDLKQAIRNYIYENDHSHPEQHADDINEIERLRIAATAYESTENVKNIIEDGTK